MNKDIFFENAFYPFRIFTWLSLSFLSGIIVVSFLPLDYGKTWPIVFLSVSLFLFLSFVNFLLKNRFFTLISWCLICLLLGFIYLSHFNVANKVSLNFGQELTISGKIAANPTATYQGQTLIIKTETFGNKSVKIMVNAGVIPKFQYGDRVSVTGKLTDPNLSTAQNYYKFQLIKGIISMPTKVTLDGVDNSWWARFAKISFGFVGKFELALNKSVTEPHSSLAAGLAFGAKRNMPANFVTDLKITGLTHIIALSGYNVTIILAIFSEYLVVFVGRRRAFFFGAILVLFFVFITGAASSIVRAAIFSLLILFGKSVGKMADATNIMILAAVVMVLFNPLVLVNDVGFQLSFLAFCGLIYLSPILKHWLERGWQQHLPAFIKMPLAETLGAQFAVLPIMAFSFHQISLISPISNIAVLWIVPLAMLLSFAAGFAGMVYLPLGQIMGLILWPVLEYIIKVVEVLAKIPFASIKLP